MGLELIGIIVSVVTTVVGFILESSAAKKEAKQARKQLAIDQAQRKLQEQREKARLLREARERRGDAVATAAGGDTLASSAAAGGIIAITTGVGREVDFVNRFGALSDQSDDITKQQIAAAQQNRIFSAGVSAVGGLVSGISSFSGASPSGPVLFGAPSSPVAPVASPASTSITG